MKQVKKLFWGLGLWMVSCTIWAQSPHNFEKIDRAAQKINWNSKMSLQELTDQLVQNCTTEKEKIRSIFTWVTHRIVYDNKAIATNKILPINNIKLILDRGKAICSGYAHTIQKLSELAGITCVVVTGYASASTRLLSINETPDHAWNVVKIGAEWLLLDATWAASYVPLKNSSNRLKFESYFLVTPRQFIKSHLPGDPRWQLLDYPISYTQFQSGLTTPSDSVLGYYHFMDSIEQFINLPYAEKQIVAAENQYRFFSSSANGGELGHALVDFAGRLSDQIDTLNPEKDQLNILELQNQIIRHLDKAYRLIEMYDWQLELYIATLMNQAVLFYNYLIPEALDKKAKDKSIKEALDKLKKIQLLSDDLPEGVYKQNIKEYSNQYLKSLEDLKN